MVYTKVLQIYYRHVFFENWPFASTFHGKILNKKSIKIAPERQATTLTDFFTIARETIPVACDAISMTRDTIRVAWEGGKLLLRGTVASELEIGSS